MNNGLQPVSSNFSGAPYLSNAWLKTTQFADHAITYIQGIPAEMNRSTIATITVIALANAVIIYAANRLANHLDSHYDFKTNPTIPKERTYRHIAVREFLTAGAVFATNLVLAVAAKVQLNEVTIGLFGAAAALAVAIRLFQNREKAVTPETQTTKTTTTTASGAESDLEIAKLKAQAYTAEREAQRANELQEEKRKLEIQVQALENLNKGTSEKFEAAKKEFTAKTAATEKEISGYKSTIEKLEQDKKSIEALRQEAIAKIASLEEQIKKLRESKAEESELAASSAQEALAKENHKLTAANSSLRKELSENQGKIAQLEQAIRSTEGELTAAKKTIDKNIGEADAKFGELNGQIEAERKAVARSEREKDRLKTSLEEAKKETEASKAKSENLEQLNQKLIDGSSLLKAEIRDLNIRLELTTKMLAKAHGTKDDPIDEIEEADGLRFTVYRKEDGKESKEAASAPSTPTRRIAEVIHLDEAELTASAKKRTENFLARNTTRKKKV